ncbi:hypothetical protein TNCV_4580741 [Trichonephila clavipes]|nr:hypothetical protein TNCV_4580741 [Trichonephila clavipes]
MSEQKTNLKFCFQLDKSPKEAYVMLVRVYEDQSLSVNYTRAFGDGPRNFEPWSSDVDDTSAGIPSPNYHTTPTGSQLMRMTPELWDLLSKLTYRANRRILSNGMLNVHSRSTRRIFSGTEAQAHDIRLRL